MGDHWESCYLSNEKKVCSWFKRVPRFGYLVFRLGLLAVGGVLLVGVLAWYLWKRRTAPSTPDTFPMS